MHPDDFLLDRLDEAPAMVIGLLREQAEAFRKPPMDLNGLLFRLHRAGVGRFAEEVRQLAR